MTDITSISLILLIFLLAGTVKGIIGMGLPTVSLGFLSMVFELPSAMALMLFPSLVTNLWQAFSGGQEKLLITSLWRFFLTATIVVYAGGLLFRSVELYLPSALLGVLLIIYGIASIAGFKIEINRDSENLTGILAGSTNGFLTGLTGSFVVPGVLYLQALDMPRDMLIQAMGMLFSLSTLALFFSLHSNEFITSENVLQSAAGTAPAILGMVLGRHIRVKLSDIRFRQIFYYSLVVMGSYIYLTAMMDYH